MFILNIFLTALLVLVCLVLILLVLVQLPKKEAGMGQAFGGGATDALFGAGSGTALTKMTKYTTGIFFVLTLLLWVLKAQEVKHKGSDLEKAMQQLKAERPPAQPSPSATAPATTAAKPTNAPLLLTSTNLLSTTASNAPVKGATNSPGKTATNAPAKPEAQAPK